MFFCVFKVFFFVFCFFVLFFLYQICKYTIKENLVTRGHVIEIFELLAYLSAQGILGTLLCSNMNVSCGIRMTHASTGVLFCITNS